MSSSSKIEKIFKTKEVVHLDFETGEERNVIEVQSIDLIIIDSDDEPVDKEGMKGGLVVEDEQEDSSKTDSWNIDEILDASEQEESSKTDSWNIDEILDESEEESSKTVSLNEQPSSGQTAGNSSLTRETDSRVEENEEAYLLTYVVNSPGPEKHQEVNQSMEDRRTEKKRKV